MKKLALTIAIVLGLGLTTFADPEAGLFNRGYNAENGYSGNVYFNSMHQLDAARNGGLLLPEMHGETEDQPGAPLGSGIAMLLGLGGAYLVAKKRREE